MGLKYTWELAEGLFQLAGGHPHAGDPPPKAAKDLQRIQVQQKHAGRDAQVIYGIWVLHLLGGTFRKIQAFPDR